MNSRGTTAPTRSDERRDHIFLLATFHRRSQEATICHDLWQGLLGLLTLSAFFFSPSVLGASERTLDLEDSPLVESTGASYSHISPASQSRHSATSELGAIDSSFRSSTSLPTPWYRTAGAISLYAAALLLAYLHTRRSTLRLQKKNTELEALIDERTRALEHANEKLQRANSIKKDFLASMSHEIRNPLNGILGITRMLEESESDKERIGYLNACARHLHQLLGQVLDFSTIEAGKVKIQTVAFDPVALCHDAIDMHRIMAEEKGLTLEADFGAFDYQWIGDSVLMKQIIVNLLSNAIKYTNSGSVRFRNESTTTGRIVHVKFSVEDTGPGIPKDQTEYIFKSFTRLENADQAQVSGTGLGLAIASELAEKMGGELYLDGSYENGARFTLELELAVTRKAVSLQTGPLLQKLKVLLTGKRVLVAEDMDFNRYVCSQFFKSLGADVTAIPDGDQALATLGSMDFEIAVLDINMPGQSGIEVVRNHLQSERSTSPVFIAVSAHVGTKMERNALQAGFSSFIEKPLDPAKLLSALRAQIPPSARPSSTDLLTYLQKNSPEEAASLEERFRQSLSSAIAQLETHLSNREPELAREAFHRLKGIINLRRQSEVPEIIESLSAAMQDDPRANTALNLCQRLKEISINAPAQRESHQEST